MVSHNLVICSSLKKFKDQILRSPNPAYAFIGVTGIHHSKLKEFNDWAKKEDIKELAAFKDCDEDTLKEIDTYFSLQENIAESWYFSYASRVLLAIEGYSEIQKIFFLCTAIQKQPSFDFVVLCNDQYISSLLHEIFCQKINSSFALPSFRAWGRFGRTVLRAMLNNLPHLDANKLLIFSLTSSPPKAKEDTYFGQLPSIASQFKTCILVYLSSGNRIKLAQNSGMVALESFLSPIDVIRAWLESFYKCFFIKNSYLDANTNSLYRAITRYLILTEIRNGDYFYHHLLDKSFKQLFESIRPETLIYPFENRSWEKLLLRNAYKLDVKDCIGYQHSSITPRHLALQIKNHNLPKNVLPTKVITVGAITYKWLCEHSPLIGDKLIVGGSLRRSKSILPRPKKFGLLVAISSNREEALNMLSCINLFSHLSSLPLIIRSHPTIPINDIYKSFEWPSSISLSSNRTLEQDISDSALIIYSSSTVALEGMLSGRLPIYLNIGNLPSGDPLLGSSELTYSASNEHDLLNIIQSIQGFNQDYINDLQDKAIKYAENYLTKISSEEFIKLI